MVLYYFLVFFYTLLSRYRTGPLTKRSPNRICKPEKLRGNKRSDNSCEGVWLVSHHGGDGTRSYALFFFFFFFLYPPADGEK